MPWGSEFWGDTEWGSSEEFTHKMISRLLMFCQNGPKFTALTNSLASRTAGLRDAAGTVAAAFGINDAVGAQLDILGLLLQRPRFGMVDDRYRDLLHVQIDLILSSVSSAETLLSIFQRITGAAATVYDEFYPAQFRIGGPVDPDDIVLLRSLLTQAKGWGIYGSLVVAPEDGFVLLGDVIGETVVDPGSGDVIGEVVADAYPGAVLFGV